MKSPINRRDFLKLSGLLAIGAGLPRFWTLPPASQQNSGQPNILIVVFDTFSAADISLYGFPRETTPNISRLAEKAIVYHNHISGGKFTTPGTASLLTGTQPWTHRAFNYWGKVTASKVDRNIFQVFSDYHRMAYTHNPFAHVFLRQFMGNIDDLTPREDLYITNEKLLDVLFSDDMDAATIGWLRAFKKLEDVGGNYSLFLSRIYESLRRRGIARYQKDFPLGLPSYDGDNFFILEDGIDWLIQQAANAPTPYLGYFHFYPPHDPYHPRADFYKKFADDGYKPVDKPNHPIGKGAPAWKLLLKRTDYDEFIGYVDAEFGRLHEALEQNGLLENTWLVLTSDHGEMFERGIKGHITPALHQPQIHIPLLIFPPGNTTRTDIYEITSAIDVLPTLCQITGRTLPDWVEGEILPPFATQTRKKDIYTIDIGEVDEDGAIINATVVFIRGNHKLLYYFGYEELGGDIVEIYDIVNDSEELVNLYAADQALSTELFEALKTKLAEVNDAYIQQNS